MALTDLWDDPKFQKVSRKVRSIIGRVVCFALGLYGVRNAYVNPNEWENVARVVSGGFGFLLLLVATTP